MLPKVRCVMVSSLLFMVSGGQAWSTTPVELGRVNMQGSIIESACAIDTQSRDQTIDMNIIPISQIVRDGYGIGQPFSIRLVNCLLGRTDPNLADWQRFQITFDGRADTHGFGIDGGANGLALEITDIAGNIVHPGKASSAKEFTFGEQTLNYTVRLVGNRQLLKAGGYYTTLSFKMDYY